MGRREVGAKIGQGGVEGGDRDGWDDEITAACEIGRRLDGVLRRRCIGRIEGEHAQTGLEHQITQRSAKVSEPKEADGGEPFC